MEHVINLDKEMYPIRIADWITDRGIIFLTVISHSETSSRRKSDSKKTKSFSRKPDLEYVQLMKLAENQYEDPRKFHNIIIDYRLVILDNRSMLSSRPLNSTSQVIVI